MSVQATHLLTGNCNIEKSTNKTDEQEEKIAEHELKSKKPEEKYWKDKSRKMKNK